MRECIRLCRCGWRRIEAAPGYEKSRVEVRTRNWKRKEGLVAPVGRWKRKRYLIALRRHERCGGPELGKKKVAPCWESVRARRQGWFVRCEPLPGWLKEFQPHGIGMVWKGSAINNMRARTDSAAEESNENVLIGRPGIVGQNARAVRAEVDRRGNLMAGIFETLKFDHHLLRNAALAAERRESVYHGLLAPFSL
jgi:hypothetical protein